MAGGDRRLQRIGAPGAKALGFGQRRKAAADQHLVPEGTVLLEQQDRLALGIDARLGPRGLDLHERHQPMHLGLVFGEIGDDAAEAQRVVAEQRPQPLCPGGSRIALVEDEVDDLEHRIEPLGPVLAARHLERHAGIGDGALGADDALRDRRFRDEESAGDLVGGEPAHEPERQRHARLGREDRVARGEDQPQQVVAHVVVERGVVVRHGLLFFR
jgi:hypothetical protein